MSKKNFLLLMVMVAVSCEKPAGTRPTSGPTSVPVERRVHVFVRGKVQGVGFRAFTKARADEVGVKGWVKNLVDGRVEGVMEGKSEAVEKVLGAVKRGPGGSRVDGVEVREEKFSGEFKEFLIVEGV